MAERVVINYEATFTLSDASTITVKDANGEKYASNALADFHDYKTVKLVNAEGTTEVPFHAIVKVAVKSTSTTETYTDENCK